jgi:hypothetical protein
MHVKFFGPLNIRGAKSHLFWERKCGRCSVLCYSALGKGLAPLNSRWRVPAKYEYYVGIAVLVVLCGYCCTCTMWVLLYLLYCVCIAGVTLDAELLARSQYSEGPATGHLVTGVSSFPCVYTQMLRWLLCFQVATICFSCRPPDLKLVLSATSYIFLLHVKWQLLPGDIPIAVNKYYYYCYYYKSLQ